MFKVLILASVLQLGGIVGIAAESAKTYQVTGPVLEVTEKTIVVQKGDERWEVARDEKTRIDGELKVGDKVTIHYRMMAVSVESKAVKSEGKKKK